VNTSSLYRCLESITSASWAEQEAQGTRLASIREECRFGHDLMLLQRPSQVRLHFLTHPCPGAQRVLPAQRQPWRRSRSARCRGLLNNSLVELSVGVAIVAGLGYSALPLVTGRARTRNAGREDNAVGLDEVEGEEVKWGVMTVISFIPLFNWLARAGKGRLAGQSCLNAMLQPHSRCIADDMYSSSAAGRCGHTAIDATPAQHLHMLHSPMAIELSGQSRARRPGCLRRLRTRRAHACTTSLRLHTRCPACATASAWTRCPSPACCLALRTCR